MAGLPEFIGKLLLGDAGKKVVERVVDKVLPPAMTEAEKAAREDTVAKASREYDLAVAELDLRSDTALWDFATKYEGAAAEVSPWIRDLRGVVRPGLTLLCVVVTLGCAVIGRKLPWEMWSLDGVMIGFWFGERAWRRINSLRPEA